MSRPGEKQEEKNLLIPLTVAINQQSTPKIEQNQLLKAGESQEQRLQRKDSSDSQSDQSEDEAQKQRENKLQSIINSETHKQAANQKMVVGTGFNMDVTQFFQFKKKQLKADGPMNIFEQISGSRLAWIILLYSVTSAAMMPGWIMNIKANKLVRFSWRFFMQMIMVIPFVLYEYRTGGENVRKKYSFSYIFDTKNFIKPLVSALASSMWFTMILAGFQWTSVSHSIVMGNLSNFFLSLGRSWRKSSHDLESGGQMIVVAGVALILYDTCTYGTEQITQYDYGVGNTFYLRRQWWERIAFDLNSFMMSFFMSQFSKFTSDLGSYYPPFLSMLIVNILTCIIMSFSSYFINACEWNYDSFWGIWSLFSNLHFTGFMYMAIMLSLGQIVSLVLITRMFPDPIIPALAMTLQPFIATLILDFSGVQKLPGNFTIVGYVFIVPGMCLILVGQCLFNRISAKRQADELKSQELLKQLKQIKERQQQRRIKKERKRAQKLSKAQYISNEEPSKQRQNF